MSSDLREPRRIRSEAGRRDARRSALARRVGVVVAAAAFVAASTVAAGTAASPAAAAPPTLGAWSWGSNVEGRLGNGTTIQSPVPVPVSQLHDVAAVATGALHGLALLRDGTVWAWGSNDSRQLGGGVTSASSYTPVPVNPLVEVTAIAAGALHSLALRADGTVWAWGRNDHGQLGSGTTASFSQGPVQVSGLTDVVSIGAGNLHSLAVRADGTVWAWGMNGFGQLGDGTTTNSSVPVAVSGVTDATAVAGGGAHSLALLADGTALTWGSVDEPDPDFGVDVRCGQLGHGVLDGSTTPVVVSGLTEVVALAAGLHHSLAVTADGAAWAWGCNGHGQLGDGTTVDSFTPSAVPGVSGAVAIAGGYDHSVAALRDGTVRAWGRNHLGQLGDGTTTDSTTPVSVSGLAGATAVAANSSFTQAIAPTVPASISGTVLEEGTDAVIAGQVCVDAERTTDGSVVATTLTDAMTGHYTLGDLGPGSFRVRFRDCNGTGHIGEYYDDGAFSQPGATTLTLVAGQHRTAIDVTLAVTPTAPTASIAGTVLEEGTDAVIAGQVCVDAERSSDGVVVGSTLTDPGTGAYLLGELAAGDYRVRFQDCNGTQHGDEYHDDAPSAAEATLVTLTNGQARAGVDAWLASTVRSLARVVVDLTGGASGCFSLYLPFFIEAARFWSPGPTACDHDHPGTVDFGPVEAGEYRLAGYGTSGEQPPYRDVTVGSSDLRFSFPGDGNPPISDDATQDVSVTVEPGVLSITLDQAVVSFGTVAGGSSASASVGTIRYRNSLAVGAPWTVVVSATALHGPAGASILFGALGFLPGATITGPGSGAVTPGTGCGTLAGSGAFSSPCTVALGDAEARGDASHDGSTLTFLAPADAPSGTYAGTLQYTILG